jgi:subtilase family serine protease
MSFREAEQCLNPKLQQTEHSLFDAANARVVSLFAAAGESGAAQLTCDGSAYIKAASIPASDPDVTGVGGTQLKADAYHNESVWNDPANSGVGGGGFSTIYARPSFQNGVEGVGWMRAAISSVTGGLAVVRGFGLMGRIVLRASKCRRLPSKQRKV